MSDLEQEGLMEKLANQSAVTVFAPNNEAWDKLGNGLKDKYSRGDACIDSMYILTLLHIGWALDKSYILGSKRV